MNFFETLECINCGEEYDVDNMISIDDDRDVYHCEFGSVLYEEVKDVGTTVGTTIVAKTIAEYK